MLSVYPSEIQQQHNYLLQHSHHQCLPLAQSCQSVSTTSFLPAARSMPHRQPEASLGYASMNSSSHHPHYPSKQANSQPQDAAVAQALEIARESPDGASDPTVSKILEHALAQIWAQVQAQPDDYVMTRDEFAVFNFFQHRFTGDKKAVAARKRYWDHARA